MENPILSVLMPVYNCEEFISTAIESVLCQTFSDFEFIIINDGSTDNTGKIVKNFAKTDSRIEVINQENHGLVFSLNKGLSIAKGKYIARHDGDDYSEKKRFEIQLKWLLNNPDHAVVFGWHNLIDSENNLLCKIEYSCNSEIIKNNLARRRPNYAHGSAIFNRKIILKYNGYNLDEHLYEDYELWTRLLRNGEKIGGINSTIYSLRFHFKSKSFIDRVNQGHSSPYNHLLQNIYFRSQNRKNILRNTLNLIRSRDIKPKEILKLFIALQPINYKWIFKYF
jgi:glycosyltransferase involved in cell wall biosynthesis